MAEDAYDPADARFLQGMPMPRPRPAGFVEDNHPAVTSPVRNGIAELQGDPGGVPGGLPEPAGEPGE